MKTSILKIQGPRLALSVDLAGYGGGCHCSFMILPFLAAHSSYADISRLLRTPVIEVLVGPSEQRFWLHRGLLRRHSLFFRGMLRGGFQESKDQVVKLPEDDVNAFAVFAEWLYVGPEADTGDVFVNMHGKSTAAADEEFLGVIRPDIFDPQPNEREIAKSEEEPHDEKKETKGRDTQTESDEEDDTWETGSTLSENARHDNYDFSLQFSCYVLADKLMAPEFKRHILDEIHHHAEFCDPSNLIVDMIRYIYKNTVSGDSVRKICIFLKCVSSPIEETLADPKFQGLMEEGGPLVSDVMEVCRRHAAKENWEEHAEAIELEIKHCEDKLIAHLQSQGHDVTPAPAPAPAPGS